MRPHAAACGHSWTRRSPHAAACGQKDENSAALSITGFLKLATHSVRGENQSELVVHFEAVAKPHHAQCTHRGKNPEKTSKFQNSDKARKSLKYCG